MASTYSFLFVHALLTCLAKGSGFDYPVTMPSPIEAQNAFLMNIVDQFVPQYETAIAIRITNAGDLLNWNCIAVYHETALDAATKQPPLVRAPDHIIEQHGTSNTRALCANYAMAILLNNILPESLETYQNIMDSFGLDSSLISPDESVSACGVTDAQCLHAAANAQGYTPEIMASIVAYLLVDILRHDGWNADGSLAADGSACTANCNPYSDYTQYEPKLGEFDRWQPLQEYNGKGFSYHYDHVVPHIGPMARLRYSSREQINRRRASDPKYDYQQETAHVIERLADLSNDDEKKLLVEFFDDKLRVNPAVLLAVETNVQWTYEQRVFFMTGTTSSEYEAVIAAWNEKRRWDKVRPTTLIKQGVAGKRITTYGGPYQGLQSIKAQDFESYIRTMPHSEYPSATGCICLAIQEFTDTVLRERYGLDSVSVDIPFPDTPFASGSSKIEAGVSPQQDLYVTMSDMMELRDVCSDSRLNGGMHYSQSIDGAYELCESLGTMSYVYMDALERGDQAALKKLAKKGCKGWKRQQKKRMRSKQT